MPQKLWEADSQTKLKSNLFEFEKFLAKNLIINLKKITKNYSTGQLKTLNCFGLQYGNIQILMVLKKINFIFLKKL